MIIPCAKLGENRCYCIGPRDDESRKGSKSDQLHLCSCSCCGETLLEDVKRRRRLVLDKGRKENHSVKIHTRHKIDSWACVSEYAEHETRRWKVISPRSLARLSNFSLWETRRAWRAKHGNFKRPGHSRSSQLSPSIFECGSDATDNYESRYVSFEVGAHRLSSFHSPARRR